MGKLPLEESTTYEQTTWGRSLAKPSPEGQKMDVLAWAAEGCVTPPQF